VCVCVFARVRVCECMSMCMCVGVSAAWACERTYLSLCVSVSEVCVGGVCESV